MTLMMILMKEDLLIIEEEFMKEVDLLMEKDDISVKEEESMITLLMMDLLSTLTILLWEIRGILDGSTNLILILVKFKGIMEELRLLRKVFKKII